MAMVKPIKHRNCGKNRHDFVELKRSKEEQVKKQILVPSIPLKTAEICFAEA